MDVVDTICNWYFYLVTIWLVYDNLYKRIIKKNKQQSKLGSDIPQERIEALHRISNKNSTVIVKFAKRKDCLQVWSVKKDLQKIKIEDVNLSGQNKLSSKRILCPHYKVLWSRKGKNLNFYISGDTIKIKVSENSSPLSITHVDDFGKYFPDINLSLLERYE